MKDLSGMRTRKAYKGLDGETMEDSRIVDMYWERDEAALKETATKYGRYLNSISFGILHDAEDAKECVNDTYNDAWESMPPHRPLLLSTFLGKITRRISIDLLRKKHADKRGGGEMALALDELDECVQGSGNVEDEIVRRELVKKISELLQCLPETERKVFMRRYWYIDSVAEIAERFGFSESKVKSMLFRTRNKLREELQKEGY